MPSVISMFSSPRLGAYGGLLEPSAGDWIRGKGIVRADATRRSLWSRRTRPSSGRSTHECGHRGSDAALSVGDPSERIHVKVCAGKDQVTQRGEGCASPIAYACRK